MDSGLRGPTSSASSTARPAGHGSGRWEQSQTLLGSDLAPKRPLTGDHQPSAACPHGGTVLGLKKEPATGAATPRGTREPPHHVAPGAPHHEWYPESHSRGTGAAGTTRHLEEVTLSEISQTQTKWRCEPTLLRP